MAESGNLGRWGRGETMPVNIDWVWKPGARPNFSDQQIVNHTIAERITRKQDDLFIDWLDSKGLHDYRLMAPGEERTKMKHRIFAALYGGETSD